MSRVVRKPAFCICENKDADQLCSNCTADQRLCFRYSDSTIPVLTSSIQMFKPLAILCGCTARFVSYLVGNPVDRFSHNEAQIIYGNDNLLPITTMFSGQCRSFSRVCPTAVHTLRQSRFVIITFCIQGRHLYRLL